MQLVRTDWTNLVQAKILPSANSLEDCGPANHVDLCFRKTSHLSFIQAAYPKYLAWAFQDATAGMTAVDGPDASLPQPLVGSVRDLATLCDVGDIETGTFLRSTFSFVDEHHRVWFGQLNLPRTKLTVDDLNRNLELVSDERIYPRVTPLITIADNTVADGAFVKRPKFSHLDEEDCLGILPRMFYEEIEVLEALNQHPHQNVVQYYGCIVKRGHIIGIVLERYKTTLAHRIENDTHNFDNALCMEQIQAGVRHLHSLGYAHNDLNPRNIALDKDDRPIIIDFGSCKKFGEELLSAGTPGWAEEYSTSEACHDEDAIGRIRAWLGKK